jgi:predicted transposase YdaD
VSHSFDASLKDIMGQSATDLTPALTLPSDLPSRRLNIDLSTISAATDVAFGYGEPLEQIVDINFQSGPDAGLDARLLLYNAAYRHHYAVPVRTIVILLRPAANLANLTGLLTYEAGQSRLEFRYEVVRLWLQPVEPFLTGGLALLALAPLCQLPADVPVAQALRDVIHQIDQRLAKEANYARAVQLMTATFVLTGLRVDRKTLADLFRGVKIMHESSAFDYYEDKGLQQGLQQGMEQGLQQGLQQGRVEESHRLLLRLGANRFGSADAATQATLRAIRDIDRLERMADAVLTARDWSEFLSTQ